MQITTGELTRVRPHLRGEARFHLAYTRRSHAMLAASKAAARHVAAPATIRSLGRTSRSNPPRGGPRHLYGPVVQLFHPAGPPGGTTAPTVSKAPTATTAATARRNPRQLVAHLDEYVVGQNRAKRVLAVA